MKINRNNYETIFLLYVDKELNEQERAEVEAFVEANPDLAIELNMLQEAVLQPELEKLPGLTESLLKFSNPVNESNYEEYFVRYGDNELSREEKEFTEQFVYRHPQYQPEFELILEARLVPDNSVVHPDKESLFRSEKDERRVIPFGWKRIAAAAVLLLLVGSATWMVNRNSSANDAGVQVANTNGPKSTKTEPNPTPSVTPDEQQLAKNNIEKSEQANVSLAATDNRTLPVSKKSEKKSVEASNKTELPIVEDNNSTLAMNTREEKTPQAAAVKADLRRTDEIQVMDRAVSERELLLASVETSTPVEESEVLQETDNSNVVYIANTTVNKRSRLRGIVRKASRFLEKAASIDPGGNERGLRIANLEIALK